MEDFFFPYDRLEQYDGRKADAGSVFERSLK